MAHIADTGGVFVQSLHGKTNMLAVQFKKLAFDHLGGLFVAGYTDGDLVVQIRIIILLNLIAEIYNVYDICAYPRNNMNVQYRCRLKQLF